MYKFKFVDIGEGLHEGTVGEVSVKVGDVIKEGDSLFTVETDKVNSEMPSPVDGTIRKILIKEGETVHVGDVTFHIDDGSADEEVEATSKKVEETPVDDDANASVVGEVKVSNDIKTFGNAKKTVVSKEVKVLATPIARKMARDKGIDINQIKGTGPQGRVSVKDVESFNTTSTPKKVATKTDAKTTSAAANIATTKEKALKPVKGLDGRREKIAPIRKAIAKAMKNSWSNVAYTNLVNEVNMTKLWDLRKSIKDQVLKTTGVKLTFLPYIAKAVAVALQEFPIMGAKLDEAASEMVFPTSVNLGIAVDTEAGLMVPVVKDAHHLNLLELSTEIGSLAKAAREKTIKGNQMQGGTFTISNYGSVGSMFGVPVINYPEIAIAGVGAIIDRPVVKAGQIVPGKIMNLTVAADHRWVDGATIGRFAYRIKELLEQPEILGVY